MPFYRVQGIGLVHFKIGGRRQYEPMCRAPHEWSHNGQQYHECCRASSFACDAPVGGEGHTCDMPLCDDHAHQVGPNRHLCPKHRDEQVQQQPELF